MGLPYPLAAALLLLGALAAAIGLAVLLVLAVDRLLDWWQFRRAYRRMRKADRAAVVPPWTDPLVRWVSKPRGE